MKFETNTPKNVEDAYLGTGESLEEHIAWRKQFIEGPPKGTKFYTKQELEKQGLIGLYKPE